jgi:uncharacterized protein YndB with AHSA1/START domain
VKTLIILLALIFGGLWFYGQRLPREHTIKSTIVLTAPVDTVFNVMRRIGNQAAWWSDVRSVRALTTRRKETWEQNMVAGGLVTLEVSAVTPPNRLITTIVAGDGEVADEMKWGGKWKFYVFAGPSGTQVEITEEGWVDPPLYRVFMKVRGETRTIDSFLTSLGAHFGEMVTPRHGN